MLPSDLSIRPYESKDWAAICKVHDAARRDELRLAANDGAFLTLQQTGENEGLFAASLDVGLVDGTIVGFVGYSQTELTWLYVDPQYYGKGYGRALLRHAINAAGPVFETEVLTGNEPAHLLYRSEGFELVKVSEGRLAGNEAFAASASFLRRTST